MCLSTLAFTRRDLGKRPNAARCDIVDPRARLGYGEENGGPGLLFERRLGLGLMQNLDGGNADALQGTLMTVLQVDDAAGASAASEGAGAGVGSLISMPIESGRTMMRVT
jgi:hypothetical protein